MKITNERKSKEQIHGIKNSITIMPGQSINIKEKDISKIELDRIQGILKIESDAVEKPVVKSEVK